MFVVAGMQNKCLFAGKHSEKIAGTLHASLADIQGDPVEKSSTGLTGEFNRLMCISGGYTGTNGSLRLLAGQLSKAGHNRDNYQILQD